MGAGRVTTRRVGACGFEGKAVVGTEVLVDDARAMTPLTTDAARVLRRCLAFAVCVSLALTGTFTKAAPNPPSVGWRHDGTGEYPSTVPPPLWSLESRTNILWQTPLPSSANASPVVVDERVFLITEPSTLLALSTRNGRILWQDDVTVIDALDPERAKHAKTLIVKARAAEATLYEVQRERRVVSRKVRRPGDKKERAANQKRLAELDQQQSDMRETIAQAERYWGRARNDTLGYASATPVSDGKHVYVVYGTGVVASYTVKGKRRWLRWLGEPHRPMRGHTYGHAAGPLLINGHLIVALGSLHALDTETGQVQWRAGIYDDFGTPVAVDVGGAPAVATPRGLVYRVRDGVLLADVKANTVYVGPLASKGHVYWVGSTEVSPATKDYGTMAMAVDAKSLDAGGGQVAPLWRVSLGTEANYATAATDGELLYAVDRMGLLTIIDVRTGAVTDRYQAATGFISASPVIAAGFIYLFGEDGRTVIGRAGRKFSFHAACQTEGGRATPYVSEGRLYIRSATSLVSVGER
jgi:outer membrane protein assembly factor BamB